MIECLDAGCAGFLLAPDLLDYSARIMRLYDAGDRPAAAEAYARTLPVIQFVMQSIEHLICYGKRLFALRAGLTVHDRSPALRPDSNGMVELERIADDLGPFPLRK
jgi:2-keto-3-deoxy-L-arabinonate dehydratase